MPEKFSPEEIYKKLLEKKTIERKRMAQEKEKKRMAPLFEFFEKVKRESKEFELSEEFELEKEERILEEEISEMVSPKQREEIIKASQERLKRFLSEKRRKEKLLKSSKQEFDKARREIFEIPVAELSEYTYGKLSDWERWNETKEEEIEEKLPNQSAESFMAHWLLKLREYKRQLPSGIVETENVKERKERAKNILVKNRLIGLVGETGTRKTRIARKIAEELTGQYEFVAGHKFMSKEDFFVYLGIDIKEIEGTPPEKVSEIIKKAKERYKVLNPDLPPEEEKEAERWLEEVIIGRTKTKEEKMVSEIMASGVLKGLKKAG